MIHAMIINHCQSISGKIISENSLQNFVTSLFYHYVRFRICNSSSSSSNSNSSSNSIFGRCIFRPNVQSSWANRDFYN